MANNNMRPRPTVSQRSRVALGCMAAEKYAECLKAARRWSARCQSCAYANHSFHRCRIQFQHDDPDSTNENSKASDRQEQGEDSWDGEDPEESHKSPLRDGGGNCTPGGQGDGEFLREDTREGRQRGQRSDESQEDASELEYTGDTSNDEDSKRSEAIKGTHEKAKRTRDRTVRIVELFQTSKTLRIADQYTTGTVCEMWINTTGPSMPTDSSGARARNTTPRTGGLSLIGTKTFCRAWIWNRVQRVC